MKKNFFDGWLNVLSGLGGRRDSSQTNQYVMNPYMQLKQELNGLYSQNWIGGKIINIPIDDALKGGIIINGDNQEVLHEALEAYKIESIVKKAFKWSKVFGGAVIIIVSTDDEIDKPFYIKNMKKGDLQRFVVLDRFDVFNHNINNQNPLDDRYLESDYYQLTKDGKNIHHSRVIKIEGIETTNYDKEMLNGWGLSQFESIYKAMMNANVSPQLLTKLLETSNQDVFKLFELNDKFENESEHLITKRLQSIMDAKSIFNGIVLDKEDEYINVSKNFSGLAELNREFYQIVAAAADIPYTRFMATGATGISGSLDGDLKNYYDRLESQERAEFYPVITKMIDIIEMSLTGNIQDRDITFKSLFQMTDEQKSVIRNRDAQTDGILLTNNIITELDAKMRLASDESYPTITTESVQDEIDLFGELGIIEETI